MGLGRQDKENVVCRKMVFLADDKEIAVSVWITKLKV